MASAILEEHRETAELTHRWFHGVINSLEEHQKLSESQSTRIDQQQETIARLEAKVLQLSRELENKNGQTIGLCRRCRRRT
jgi:hypothetical protein